MAFWNRKYKDSVFTDLFGSDRDGKKNFLELYNALSGSDYKLGEVSLKRKVIEQALYKTKELFPLKNDMQKRYTKYLIRIFMLCMLVKSHYLPNRNCGCLMHFSQKTAVN